MKKVISYIGFAKKANKIVIGQGSLKRCSEQIYLIMVCNTATENLKNLAQNLAKKHNCQTIVTSVPLEQLTNLENVKIIGILDQNLANGILLNKESVGIG